MKKVTTIILTALLLTSCAPKSEILKYLFSWDTRNQLVVDVPDLDYKCTINKMLNSYPVGYYEVDYEKGVIAIDYPKIFLLNNSDKIIIPFTVSNQGTGSFEYLGLFKINQKFQKLTHLDSLYLGDRISLTTVAEIEPGVISCSFYSHSETESYVDTPTKVNLIVAKISDNLLVSVQE